MTRPDAQLTGMAGEFLAVGKLFKRGYQASVTFGNAKGIDLLVYNSLTNKSFNVQVKTLRHKNGFPIRKEDIKSDHIYVFILLHDFNDPEDFFILPGSEILNKIDYFYGSSYKDPRKPSSVPCINYGPLREYKDNWQVFDG
jgi:hypothetical protein